MEGRALSPCSPSRLCVQPHPRISSCQCRQQLVGSSWFSSRGPSFSHREPKIQTGGIDVGGFVSSKSSRIWKFKSIPAFNFVGDATSSQNKIGLEKECRTAVEPAKNYTVREAKLDEELWAAAWIRAESYCEEQPYVRYIESYKKRFAEQEFDALKRRLVGKYGQSIRCICLVAVSGQSSKSSTMNGTRSATVLERVVGTLDLSVRQLSQGETFPGDSIRATLSVGALDFRRSHQYGYIANLCVTKAARQNGVGSNLLDTAINVGKDWALNDLYVHVNSSNKAAQCLYNKFDFQELQLQTILTCFLCRTTISFFADILEQYIVNVILEQFNVHTKSPKILLSQSTPFQLHAPSQYFLEEKKKTRTLAVAVAVGLTWLVPPH